MAEQRSIKDVRSRRRKRFVVMTLLLPLVLIVAYASFTLGGFYNHRQLFNLAAEAKDTELIEQEMEALGYYYSLSGRLGLRWAADRFWYKENYIDRAVRNYLIGDFDAVINDKDLQDNRNNHLASQLVASAKFRRAQALYGSAKTETEKEKIIKMVNEEISEDFKVAVEKGPGPDVYFNHSFNFDLSIDPEDTKKALEGPGPPRLTLGYKPNSGTPKDGEPGRIDPTKPGGGSDSKKKG